MKIAIFQTGPLQPGGAEFVIHYTANYLVQKGHEVIVFVARPMIGFCPESICEIMPCKYEVYHFTCPVVKGVSLPWAGFNLLGVVRKRHIEIVHAHTLHTSGYIAVRIRPLMGVPVLVTGHGEDVQVDMELKYGCRLNSRHDNAVKITLRNADGVTAISRAMARDMLDAGASKDKLWIIPNGVLPSKLPDVQQVGGERSYVFAMGRLIKKKGFDVLVQAFSLLRQRGINNVDLLIAGEGPEQHNLQSLVRKLHLDGSVRFVGFLDEDGKRKAFNGCRFFICPSLREPFGIVILEAMAAMRAVIAADVDGIPDLVVSGQNGLLYPKGNALLLAEQMAYLLTNIDVADCMGKRGRLMSVQYTWDKIAAKYSNVYDLLVGDNVKGAK